MTFPSPRQTLRRAELDRAREGARLPDEWFANVPAIAYVRGIEDSEPPRAAATAAIGPQVATLLGIDPAAFLDDPHLWAARIHPDDLGRVLATWRETHRRGERYRLSYRMLAADGHIVKVRDEAVVVEDPSTGGRSWHGVVIDVTADAPTAPDLHEAVEKYRLLVEQIPAVTYIDEVPADDPTDLSPAYISPQIERLLGYTPAEWLSDPDLWDRVTHPDDVAAAETGAGHAFETGTPLSIEYRMIARDGRVVWVREEASLFRDEHGVPKFWQGVYVDITELKRAEGELNHALRRERDAAERLRALDEMKNTFLQAVSHDLRTPLAAILGLALTLERTDIDLSSEDVHDLASRIAANSRKLDRLVADLLDLDRLTRGIIGPKLLPTEISPIVHGLVEQMDIADDRDVVEDLEPVTIPVDGAKLERIVENLLANAVRHTPDGATIWIRTRPADGGASIVVEDDGPGIPDDLREAVFEPFRQGPSQSSHSPGAGVGLALVAKFAELHHGRAWVEDRPGGGASFHVFLPGTPGTPG